MPILNLIAQIKAKPGREADLEAVLRALIPATRAETGCLTYDLHVDNEDPAFFTFYEAWASVPEWERHMAAPHLEDFKARSNDLVADWKLFQLTKIA